MYTFFTAKTTDGSSPAFNGFGGEGLITVTGTFNSCTVTIEVSNDGTNFVKASSDGALTAAGAIRVSVPYESKIRATVSAAGASTSVTCLARTMDRS